MYPLVEKLLLFLKLLFAPKDQEKKAIKKVVKKEERIIKKEERTIQKEIKKQDNNSIEKKIEQKQEIKSDSTSSTVETQSSGIALTTLRKGSQGSLVEQWQLFLVGQGFLKVADGDFGNGTKEATIKFQLKYGLIADGVVGNTCYGKAMTLGFEIVADPSTDKNSADWPPKPNFEAMYNDTKREEAFGKMEYTADEKGNLIITNNWKEENIITIDIPQLKGIDMYGKPKASGSIYFHKKGEKQMKALWSDWEKAGLLHLVKTWGGTYNARFIRGSSTKLSNHAYGTAFDINVKWNGLAKRPALVGEEGSVRELVEIANKNGFYWGGHFSRKDGMHFEIAQLL